ncbi:MAG: asparagine synthase (glutamine-hydrolyzing) [Polyangiales bacterium]
MCGITGFLARDGALAPADLDAVRRMNAAQTHRGPDAEGLWSAGPCALGHRRLSIIDLSDEARQPLVNEDGTVAVVVNGEIYNFATLREELRAKGHRFRSQSDSEVVVHLWEEHGPDAVARLQGMFALALFDAKQQTLLLARDRTGKKPLHLRETRRGLAFSSELRPLLTAFPDEPATPDLTSLDLYLTLQYVPAPRSAVEGVRKLPAASLATVRPGEPVAPRRWWAPRFTPVRDEPLDALARALREALGAAVARRMVADVPLGAFLSGGLDSSAVVGLMAERSPRPVKTFSIGFPHADDSELTYAREVAARFGTDHHELIVEPDMTDVLPRIVDHHGEPFADSSSVATWYLAEMTRRHVTVALSGDGSDEALAGYKRYLPMRIAHAQAALPSRLGDLARRVAAAGISRVDRAVGRFARDLGASESVRYLHLVGKFSAEEKSALYGPAMRALLGEDHAAALFAATLDDIDAPTALGRLLELDRRTWLADDINPKVDIASMAHALEVRCPFLDTEVLELAARLPARALFGLRGKRVLREATRDLLPRGVRHRVKRGFALPLERWMRHDLKAMTRDLLLGADARTRDLFEPAEVRRICDEVHRDAGNADRLWTLLVLELWLRSLVPTAPGGR